MNAERHRDHPGDVITVLDTGFRYRVVTVELAGNGRLRLLIRELLTGTVRALLVDE